MAKLGKYVLHVETESPKYAVEATSYPVEKGVAFTDHVKNTPDTLSISGYILSEQSGATAANELRQEMKKGTVFTYAGRFLFTSCIIKSFNPTADANVKNGFKFTMELQQIRMAQSSYVAKTSKQNAALSAKTKDGKKVVQKSNSVAYHTVRKGDFLWKIAKKYGTTVDELRRLNNMKTNEVTIGKKVRVK